MIDEAVGVTAFGVVEVVDVVSHRRGQLEGGRPFTRVEQFDGSVKLFENTCGSVDVSGRHRNVSDEPAVELGITTARAILSRGRPDRPHTPTYAH